VSWPRSHGNTRTDGPSDTEDQPEPAEWSPKADVNPPHSDGQEGDVIGCTVCGKLRPVVSDDFCSTACAKTAHCKEGAHRGDSGTSHGGDKRNAYAAADSPYLPTTRLARERWERSEALKQRARDEKAAIARLAGALNTRKRVAA
jgi:hypothetical protein